MSKRMLFYVFHHFIEKTSVSFAKGIMGQAPQAKQTK